MLIKKNYIKRGGNVEKKKIYKEGRQSWPKKKYIKRGDNVDKKKLYKEGRQCWQKKTI